MHKKYIAIREEIIQGLQDKIPESSQQAIRNLRQMTSGNRVTRAARHLIGGGPDNTKKKWTKTLLTLAGLGAAVFYFEEQESKDESWVDNMQILFGEWLGIYSDEKLKFSMEDVSGLSYIANSVPSAYFKADNFEEGDKLVNSESLAYGMLDALKENNRGEFSEIFKTVFELAKLNFENTRLTKLVPWAVILKKTEAEDGTVTYTPEIARNSEISFYGNASAADADVDMLYALIAAKQKGWTTPEMDYYIYQLASEVSGYIVDVTNEADESFYVLASGGLVEKDKQGENDGKVKYYPSYPNYNYLSKIAEYFKQESDNDEGSTFMYEQFAKLSRDSKILNDHIFNSKDVAGDPAKMPNFVYISLNDKEEAASEHAIDRLNITSEDVEFGSAKYNERFAANARMAWRTGDNKYSLANHPQVKAQVNDANTYGYYVNRLTSSDSEYITGKIDVDSKFKIDDLSPNNNWYRRELAGLNSHWKASRFLPFIDNAIEYNPFMTKFDDEVADFSNDPHEFELMYERAGVDGNYDAKIKYGLECFKSSTRTEIGHEVLRNTLAQMLSEDTYDSSLISTSWLLDVDLNKMTEGLLDDFGKTSEVKEGLTTYNNKIELLSAYLELLDSMKGFTPEQKFKEIELLIGSVPKDKKINKNNQLLKSLYLAKIMYMSHCTDQEKEDLKDIADVFGLTSIYNIMFERLNHMVESNYNFREVNGYELKEITLLYPDGELRTRTPEQLIKEGIAKMVTGILPGEDVRSTYMVVDRNYKPAGAIVDNHGEEITLNYADLGNKEKNKRNEAYNEQFLLIRRDPDLVVETEYVHTIVQIKDLNGVNVDVDTDKATLDQVRKLNISSDLKKMLCEEIIRKQIYDLKKPHLDMLDSYDDVSKGGDGSGKLDDEEYIHIPEDKRFPDITPFKETVYKLPAQYRDGFVLNMLYDQTLAPKDRLDMLMDVFDKTMESGETNTLKGTKKYVELVRAYVDIQFAIATTETKYSEQEYSLDEINKRNVSAFFNDDKYKAMIALRDALVLLAGGKSEIQDPMLQKLSGVFDGETFERMKHVYRDTYSSTVSDVIDKSYWAKLIIVARGNDAKAYGENVFSQPEYAKLINSDHPENAWSDVRAKLPLYQDLYWQLNDIPWFVCDDMIKHLDAKGINWQDDHKFFARATKVMMERRMQIEKGLYDNVDGIDAVEENNFIKSRLSTSRLLEQINDKISISETQGDYGTVASLIALKAFYSSTVGTFRIDKADIISNKVFRYSREGGGRMNNSYYQEIMNNLK